MSWASRTKSGRGNEAEFARQLAAARAGSAEALGMLLQGCRRYLLMTAGRALESTMRPREGASDLVQRTFLVAQQGFQEFRGGTLGELLGWLNRILERQLANQVRYHKRASKRSLRRERPLDGEPENQGLVDRQPLPSERASTLDEQRRVHAALVQLPQDYQRVLELRTWQRLTFAEAGERMDRSAGAAQKLWVRAIAALQAVLGDV